MQHTAYILYVNVAKVGIKKHRYNEQYSLLGLRKQNKILIIFFYKSFSERHCR